MINIFIVLFNFICGTVVLIYGVELMTNGLEKCNTKMMRKFLITFTGRVGSAFMAGTVLTALVQSSTAVTVITVSFVNAGLIKLPQAMGIIYGTNIGTTITAQLMSFQLTNVCFPAVAVGIIMILFPKNSVIKNIGFAVAGLGLMFLGLKILNASVSYIQKSEEVANIFRVYGQNLFAGLIIGLVTTALVHSSSATVGLTIVLFNAHLITFESAVGFTLGDNIGTCITAQVASLAANINAKRTAWAHTLYNIFGVLVVLIFFMPFVQLIKYVTCILGQDETRLVANAHTIFNILSALVFLPITNVYTRFIERILPDPDLRIPVKHKQLLMKKMK